MFVGVSFSQAGTKVNTCGDESTRGYQCTDKTEGKTCVANKCLAEAANVKCCKDGAGDGGGSAVLPNPLGTVNINDFAARIINILGLVGTISLVLFIYGGLIWMTSAGSADKVKKRKRYFGLGGNRHGSGFSYHT